MSTDLLAAPMSADDVIKEPGMVLLLAKDPEGEIAPHYREALLRLVSPLKGFSLDHVLLADGELSDGPSSFRASYLTAIQG